MLMSGGQCRAGSTRLRSIGRQVSVQRIQGELESCRDTELLEDAAQVILHGLLAHDELLGDFTITGAIDDGGDHVALTRGQRLLRRPPGNGSPRQSLREIRDTLGTEPTGAIDDRVNAFEK